LHPLNFPWKATTVASLSETRHHVTACYCNDS
jgi:hypothetical protein